MIVHREVGDCLNLPLIAREAMSGTCEAHGYHPLRCCDCLCLLVTIQLIEQDRIARAFVADS